MTDTSLQSPDGKHRYWERYETALISPKVCLAIMFNPTGKQRPPGEHGATIRKCLRFAEQHGCGELRTCNLFSRKDYPDGENREPLPDPPDPIEIRRENDRHIAAEITKANVILCAWGNVGWKRTTQERAREVLSLMAGGNTEGKLYVVGFNKSGHPKHPARAAMRSIPVRVVGGYLEWVA